MQVVVWLETDNTGKPPSGGCVSHQCSFPCCPLNPAFTVFLKCAQYHVISLMKNILSSVLLIGQRAVSPAWGSCPHALVSGWPSAPRPVLPSRPRATVGRPALFSAHGSLCCLQAQLTVRIFQRTSGPWELKPDSREPRHPCVPPGWHPVHPEDLGEQKSRSSPLSSPRSSSHSGRGHVSVGYSSRYSVLFHSKP